MMAILKWVNLQWDYFVPEKRKSSNPIVNGITVARSSMRLIPFAYRRVSLSRCSSLEAPPLCPLMGQLKWVDLLWDYIDLRFSGR